MHSVDSRFLILVHSHQYKLVLSHFPCRSDDPMTLRIDWTKRTAWTKKAVDKVDFEHYDQRAE